MRTVIASGVGLLHRRFDQYMEWWQSTHYNVGGSQSMAAAPCTVSSVLTECHSHRPMQMTPKRHCSSLWRLPPRPSVMSSHRTVHAAYHHHASHQ